MLDPKGELGKLYGAQTTPHMYVIKGDGTLAYKGGIDSIASAKAEDIVPTAAYIADLPLPDDTTVWPGHDDQGRTSSSIAA